MSLSKKNRNRITKNETNINGTNKSEIAVGKSVFSVVKEWVLQCIYPSKCPFCGQVTLAGICESCEKKVRKISGPRCMKCGKPIADIRQEYCYDCKKGRHSYEWGKSLWVHRSPVSDAVYQFKYQNKRIYGKIFAGELAKEYGRLLQKKGVELLIPIPLHRSRRWKRGYNQAEILAVELGKQTGIPVAKHLLIRTRRTIPQKKLDHKLRRKNIERAFSVQNDVTTKKVVLIDDIYTTGSTIDEAAKTLKRAGVQEVGFLTISIGQGY